MTPDDALHDYITRIRRALLQPFLGFAVRNAANDNRSISSLSISHDHGGSIELT